MKKIMIILTALFTMAIQTNAMTYDQAREHALFLTDKMAYELNLTDDQYEAAYEINLDYLMSIGTYDDLYGRYWTQRNLDLSYILYDWQYNLYVAASYFYRPLTWSNGFWRFVIYSHYPHRSHLFFGRPNFYSVYRGGHSWRTNNGRSWYQGRTWGGPNTNGQKRVGMRDNYDKGNFKSGNSNNRNNVNNRSNVNRQNNRTSGTNRNNSSQFGSRNSNRTTNNGNVKSGNSTYRNSSPNRGNSTQFKNNSSSTTNSNRSSSTVGNRTNINKSTSGSNFGGRSSSTRTTVNQNRSTNINRSSKSSNIGSKPSSTFSSKGSSSSSSRSTSVSRSSSGSHSGGSKSSGSKGGGGSFGGGRK